MLLRLFCCWHCHRSATLSDPVPEKDGCVYRREELKRRVEKKTDDDVKIVEDKLPSIQRGAAISVYVVCSNNCLGKPHVEHLLTALARHILRTRNQACVTTTPKHSVTAAQRTQKLLPNMWTYVVVMHETFGVCTCVDRLLPLRLGP